MQAVYKFLFKKVIYILLLKLILTNVIFQTAYLLDYYISL